MTFPWSKVDPLTKIEAAIRYFLPIAPLTQSYFGEITILPEVLTTESHQKSAHECLAIIGAVAIDNVASSQPV
jgi:hypothetical protein